MPEVVGPSDPFTGIERLAPDVDLDTATVIFIGERSRNSRRRRIIGGTGVAATVLVLLLAIFVASDSETDVISGPDTTHSSIRENSFPLPSAGDATAALLADGTPIWLVNHGDGRVSAVEALYPTDSAPDGLRVLVPVLWDEDGAFDALLVQQGSTRALTWDPHGRSVSADGDLVRFSAALVGEQVLVTPSAPVQGPYQVEAIVRGSGASRSPTMPPRTEVEALRPGWHTVDADLAVDAAGRSQLCMPTTPERVIPDPGTCEPVAGPRDLRVALPSQGLRSQRMMSPLVIHVSAPLVLDAVYPKGGTATTAG